MLHLRQAGILCPLASLPGPDYCGDLGACARRFVDQLAAHNVGWWQLLPLHPTDAAFGNSPYSAQSVLAGDERYVSFAKAGPYAAKADASKRDNIDYAGALEQRRLGIDTVWEDVSAQMLAEFRFWRKQNHWVETYALWRALADDQGTITWTDWPASLRDVGSEDLSSAATTHRDAIDRVAFGQFLFARQFKALSDYAAAKGVRLMGDLPIYPHLDSADVWGNRDVFKLDDAGQPTVGAGVPPDYFSEDGQLWGNPVYNWEHLQNTGFAWWCQRIQSACSQYATVRIDHFIGLVRAYEVPASDENARNGSYVDVPTDALLRTLASDQPGLPIVAEDLGVEHPGVALALERWGLPGMRVLQFGFGSEASNPHLPHNFPANCVAYTGTHDNDTTLGWYTGAKPGEQAHLRRYLGRERLPAVEIAQHLMRLLWASPARLAVAPVQDVLSLGTAARINTPGTTSGNWGWRIGEVELYREEHWARLAEMLATYGR